MTNSRHTRGTFRVYIEVLVPEYQRLVKSKWVFALKSDEHEDIVTRLRARVVGGGYSQVYMRDYVETFSPTSRPEQVRLLLCLAAAELGKLGARMEYNSEVQVLCKIDIKEAYLNSGLPENEHDVFVNPPPGYVLYRRRALLPDGRSHGRYSRLSLASSRLGETGGSTCAKSSSIWATV